MVEQVVFDYSKLRGRIVEKHETVANFAEIIGASKRNLYTILKSGKPFSVSRIVEFAKELDIASCDIGLYFFTPKVSNN